MDSINKNQEEENHKDVNGAEAIKKIKELAEDKPASLLQAFLPVNL